MPQKVLFVCTEVFPLLKTGGLADVCAGLPPALAANGADVRMLLPAFPGIAAGVTPHGPRVHLPPGGSPGLPAGLGPLAASAAGPAPWLRAGSITATGMPVWLLHAPGLYERGGNPYVDTSGQPWPDSAEQFAWLGWAAAQLGCGLATGGKPWQPDVVHGHDWHTGLAFAYMHELGRVLGARPASVFTIHNLAYQGVFPGRLRRSLGLPDRLFDWQGLEFHGHISFMKSGLVYSDALTTVSPTYAREITGEEQGCGLDGLLRQRSAQLHGILNGVDDTVWNPQADPWVQPGFSASHLGGKAVVKAQLQQRMGLEIRPGALLFSVVSRLTEQKGLHLLAAVVDELVERGGQLVVLGTGEAAIQEALREAAARHPQQVALHIGYDEALAHLIIAGADVILLPSRFEPCGLTQLYGLRYGTLPLVRAVGGLADTVVDCSLENLDEGRATGFVFDALEVPAFLSALRRAFALQRRPAEWNAVQQRGMGLRFDWNRAACGYLRVYGSVTPTGRAA